MKNSEATSAATARAFDALATSLEANGVTPGKMFGMSVLKANGKAFAGVFGDALVFKLSGKAHASALELAGAKLFDPSGTGRAMKEWIVVPRAHAKRWTALASDALRYVTSG